MLKKTSETECPGRCVMADKFFLSERDIDEAAPESFLFQAGYLTIKESNPLGFYVLDFPNYEVRTTFNSFILKQFELFQAAHPKD